VEHERLARAQVLVRARDEVPLVELEQELVAQGCLAALQQPFLREPRELVRIALRLDVARAPEGEQQLAGRLGIRAARRRDLLRAPRPVAQRLERADPHAVHDHARERVGHLSVDERLRREVQPLDHPLDRVLGERSEAHRREPRPARPRRAP